MGLLEDKRLLITGVLTPQSIAFSVAGAVQEQGAEVLLTGFGRGLALTERSARRLPQAADVLEMDATDPQAIEAVAGELERRWGRLDGVLHAIAFAPEDALGGNFLTTPWESAAQAFQVSAYSLKGVVAPMLPLLERHGGSVVGLDFDASVAWPAYDWMGVAKAGLESITRYLARDVGPTGVRVNCIAAGPLRTVAAKSISGFDVFVDGWHRRAPLGWDVTDPGPVAGAAAFLFSDWSRGITGEILHVDGGYHAMGADLPGREPDPGPNSPDSPGHS
ncbi:MAG: enoyl-ACP reductase FabI [Actinomycetota bacterium]|nr:enoyl-ACP reductase FabI [Actinomycetota bacterium]